MIMMPYAWLWSSLQLKGHADFWHPTPIARRLGVSSSTQASRVRGRRHAATNHFQHVPASTAQSLLPAKGRRGARCRWLSQARIRVTSL